MQKLQLLLSKKISHYTYRLWLISKFSRMVTVVNARLVTLSSTWVSNILWVLILVVCTLPPCFETLPWWLLVYFRQYNHFVKTAHLHPRSLVSIKIGMVLTWESNRFGSIGTTIFRMAPPSEMSMEIMLPIRHFKTLGIFLQSLLPYLQTILKVGLGNATPVFLVCCFCPSSGTSGDWLAQIIVNNCQLRNLGSSPHRYWPCLFLLLNVDPENTSFSGSYFFVNFARFHFLIMHLMFGFMKITILFIFFGLCYCSLRQWLSFASVTGVITTRPFRTLNISLN